MSIKVKDTRTVISRAESLTGWIGPDTTDTTTLVEGTYSVSNNLDIATGQYYFTPGAPLDLDGQMIYVWSNNFALQEVWTAADPPNAMHLRDGTNNISFKIAGKDKKVFSHLTENDWQWDCLLLDSDTMPALVAGGYVTVRNGSATALATASITDIGVDFTTLSKALGGGSNVAIDIMRFGNDGIVISSGSIGDPGTFFEMMLEDRSTADNKAHGIIREYTPGIYGVQGPMTFGTSSENAWFEDSEVSLTFEDRDIADDKYYMMVTGSSDPAYSSSFALDGVSIATAGPWTRMDYSSDDIAKLEIINCSFRSLSGSVTFAGDISASTFHTASNTTFFKSGPIFVNGIKFDNNAIQESEQLSVISGTFLSNDVQDSVVESGSGTLLWNTNVNPNGKIDDTSFTRNDDFDNFAIEFGAQAPDTMSLSGITYTNYGPSGSTSASIYNHSGHDLQITIVGGDNPTVYDFPGLITTLILGQTEVTLTGMVSGSEVIVLDVDTGATIAQVENVGDSGEFAFTDTGGNVVNIFIHAIFYVWQSITDFTIPALDTELPIQQEFDRNYDNPS